MADYSGFLYNERGLPLINVKVVAHNAATGTVLDTVYTDSTGKWDFGALSDIPAIYAYTEFGVRLVLRGEIVGTIGGSVDMVTSGAFRIGATAVLTGDGFYTDYNAGTPRLRVGTVTGGALVKGVYWDGANLAWIGVNTSLTAAGLFTATNAVITGTITASAGAIGGFDIGADYIRDVANSFGLASTVTGGDDVRFWAGATFANRATASLRATEAGAITAAKITITSSALGDSSFAGPVTIGADGGIFQGTGTFDVPTTALKIYNSGGVGLLEMWMNGSKQVYLTTAGELFAGTGGVRIDSVGLSFLNAAAVSKSVYWYVGASVFAAITNAYSVGVFTSGDYSVQTLLAAEYALLALTATGLGGNWAQIALHQDPVAANSNIMFVVNGASSGARLLPSGWVSAGYMAAGFDTAPANTTAGDLTATRLALNGDIALTAILHLKAGTAVASTAPLKFTSGPLLTTAEAGAIEFLTDAYYATITTGAARKTFAFLESPSFTTPSLGVASATSLAATAFVTGATYLWAGTYAAVGFTSAPANTTAGDLTATRFLLGTDAAFTNGSIFQINHTITSASANQRAFDLLFTFDGAGAGDSGLRQIVTHSPSASVAIVYGLISADTLSPGAGVTITTAYANYFQTNTGSTGGAVTTSVTLGIIAPGFGTVKPGTHIGLDFGNQGSASIVTSAAIRIAAQSGSTGNWDIYHTGTAPNIAIGNGGTLSWKDTAANVLATLVDLGTTGAFNVTGHYRVAGTQVVGARVIDARIDDAIGGTWTATEQGILDACRDILIAHGLAAAA